MRLMGRMQGNGSTTTLRCVCALPAALALLGACGSGSGTMRDDGGVACGLEGQRCCADTTCSAGLDCADGTCQQGRRGDLGKDCDNNFDCAERLCLPVAFCDGCSTGDNACTFECSSASDCAPGWECLTLTGTPSEVCQCSETGSEQCDGIDNDCDGIVDNHPDADYECQEIEPNYVCRGGKCECGGAVCSGKCVDVSGDPTNCGTCAHVCEAPANASATCAGGTCGFACASGYTESNGACLPPGATAAAQAADFSCARVFDDCQLTEFWQGATCPPDPGFTVGGIVEDFQAKENIVTAVGPSAVATVTVYETTADVLANTPLAGPVQTDPAGHYSVTISKSLTRVIFKTTLNESKDTFAMGVLVKPDQTDNDRFSVADSTGTFVSAWVGVTFDTTKGSAIGTVRDCQHRPVANAIGKAVDAGGVELVPDSLVFYFNSAAGLPVKRSTRTYTDSDGRVLLLNLPPGSDARIQVLANISGGALDLVSEATIPVWGDSVVFVDLDPLRQ